MSDELEHFLVVGEFVEDDPTDRFEVEHDDKCPVGRYPGNDNDFYEEYVCHVALLEDYGITEYFRHADDPDPLYPHAVPVGVGRHRIRAWTVKHPGGPWGADEWSSGLDLVDDA